MAMDSYKITNAERDAVHVEAQPTRLVGTILQNKQVFDKYPDLIKDKHNALCEYVGSYTPSDGSLNYTSSEIAYICSVLGCTEEDISI